MARLRGGDKAVWLEVAGRGSMYAAVQVQAAGKVMLACWGGVRPGDAGDIRRYSRPASASHVSRGVSLGGTIASIAEGQEGVKDNPANTYCNRYTAYWGDGTGCSNGLRQVE